MFNALHPSGFATLPAAHHKTVISRLFRPLVYQAYKTSYFISINQYKFFLIYQALFRGKRAVRFDTHFHHIPKSFRYFQ